MKKLLLLLVWAVAAAGWAAESPATRFEIYPLGVSDGDATEEVVRNMVGEEGTVTLDRAHSRLLVVTTGEKHRLIADTIRKLDVPPMNVRIDVEFRGAMGGRKREASIKVDGHSGSTLNAHPKLEDTSYSGSSRTVQTLLVSSGHSGSLRVGEEVPYLEWLMDYGLTRGFIAQQVAWRQVGAVLAVEPTVIGEGPMVRIRLTPELSGWVDRDPYRIRFAGVTTEVTVQDGQTFQIGGLDQDREFYSRFLVGRNAAGAGETLEIYLTPHIVKGIGRNSGMAE